MVSVFVVVEHGLCSRLCQLRNEPLDARDVQHPLHTEEVDCNFNHISFADLDDRLGEGPLLDALNLVGCPQISVIVVLVLLGLVSMDPDESLAVLLHDIQFVGRHVFLARQIYLLLSFSLHAPRTKDQGSPFLVQFVGKVGTQTLIEVLWIGEHLTDKYSVKSDASASPSIDH